MANVKIILRNKANKDGTYPLALKVLKNRVPSISHLGYSIERKYWDQEKRRIKKSHPSAKRLNHFLNTKLTEAENKLLELETEKKDISSQAIRDNISDNNSTSFFTLADEYITSLKQRGKYNRINSEKPRIKHFKDFLKKDRISFQEITVTLLMRYRAYLIGERKVSERTVINHLIIIRTIFNLAIKSNIVDSKYYPFGKDKVVIKFPQSIKVGLNKNEVEALENLDLSSTPYLNHARNVWLFSFFFAGMRVSDVLRLTWDDFKDMRLHYAMGKNKKAGSLKTPEKALKILEQYRHRENTYRTVFPELDRIEDLKNEYDVQRVTSYEDKKLNKALKEIAGKMNLKKKLTMHIARHTFGNISGDKISIQMLQKLYRHSSITTTIGYQANFIHKDADDALDAVIGN